MLLCDTGALDSDVYVCEVPHVLFLQGNPVVALFTSSLPRVLQSIHSNQSIFCMFACDAAIRNLTHTEDSCIIVGYLFSPDMILLIVSVLTMKEFIWRILLFFLSYALIGACKAYC